MSVRSQRRNSGGQEQSVERCFTNSSEHSAAISRKATFAPCRANCSTMEAPMPEPPPVINTTRSCRLGYEAKRSVWLISHEAPSSLRCHHHLVLRSQTLTAQGPPLPWTWVDGLLAQPQARRCPTENDISQLQA